MSRLIEVIRQYQGANHLIRFRDLAVIFGVPDGPVIRRVVLEAIRLGHPIGSRNLPDGGGG